MALIAKSGTPSLSSPEPPPSHQTTGQEAGEDLGAFDAIYLKSDGKWYRSTGAAANAAAEVHGYAPKAYKSGATHLTVFHGGINVAYASGATPGADVYLSGTTAGGFDTATSTGGTRKLGFCLDATRIRLYAIQGR